MSKNIGAGYLYFYVHFITEIVCFYMLSSLIGDSIFLWLSPLIFDALAFVPQSIIGYISDKYPKLKVGIIGAILLFISILVFVFEFLPGKYMAIIILAIGNAFLHISGAEVTLRSSSGKLAHSAIFVSGGSFGVITGKILGSLNVSFMLILFLIITMIPFILLAEYYRRESESNKDVCSKYNYASENVSGGIVIFLAVLVVIVRGYMGYGIPTSWDKTLIQTVFLYCAMGFGKALGGILSDAFGIRKIALISTVLALPFLIFGDNLMLVSLVGVLLFSMTMSITLGLLVSVLKKTPGLAFGLTTIGLFLGTVPIFFFRINSVLYNSIIISVLTILCVIILMKIIRKEHVR